MDTTRNVRNKNPGNVKVGDEWYGRASRQTDKTFVQFKSEAWGWRALFRVLLSYKARGLKTAEQIIYRWAPPSDKNPTEEYVNFVLHVTRKDRYYEFDVDKVSDALPLAIAIARFEGQKQIDVDNLILGWFLFTSVKDDYTAERFEKVFDLALKYL